MYSTTLVVSDGLGSGVKANIAASMGVARFLRLIQSGFSLRQAFVHLVKTMQDSRGTDLPYAVFTVVNILNDGIATILSYEMPPPILISRQSASVLQQRVISSDALLINESHCQLEPGEGILVISDGISMAGLGVSLHEGWGMKEIVRFINHQLNLASPLQHLPHAVHQKARELWNTIRGDDCTATLALCRWGKRLILLTGPPQSPSQDEAWVKRFMKTTDQRVVCGATTAKIVARHTGRPLRVEQDSQSAISPPRYYLEGIDLVTEGAITLNQVYNIWDEDPDTLEKISGVTELFHCLKQADYITFVVGTAFNPAGDHISFCQMGIARRTRIVEMLAEKMRHDGKLVVIEKY